MSGEPGSVDVCRNCGAPIEGEYCALCGQEVRDLDRSVAALARELADGIFSFDSRIWRTVVPLLLRPGAVTARYLAGERVRFVPPARLYFFVSLVYFLLAAWTGSDVLSFQGELPGDGEVSAAQILREEMGDVDVPAVLEPFVLGAQRLADDPEGFRRGMIQGASYLMFFFVPLLGGLLHLFYRGRGRYYLHHLVFAAHLHVFGYLVLTLQMLLNRTGVGFLEWLTNLVPWVVLAYLVLALRRVYGGRIWTTVLRTLALGITYSMALSAGIVALVLLLLLR